MNRMDKGKRPMDPSKDPSNKKNQIFVPVADRLFLQPPTPQQPARSRLPTPPILNKGKRPFDPSKEPSKHNKYAFVAPQDMLNLQPPPGFWRTPPSSDKETELTKGILGQRARRARERSTKKKGNSDFANQARRVIGHQLIGSALNTSPSLPYTPSTTDRRRAQSITITPCTTPYRRLPSFEFLQKSLSFLNPVRLFTLPEEHVASNTHDNEIFMPTWSHQNASARNCVSTTSSLVHPIPPSTNAASTSASSSTNRNPRLQPFGDPAQYCEDIHNNGFDRPISANNADISDDEDEVDNI